MTILGISFGSKMGNSEILLRRALMSAEEKGAQVKLARIHDYSISPCDGCGQCAVSDGGCLKSCKYEDDFDELDREILRADGLIFAAPVYSWSPCATVKILAERFEPAHQADILQKRLASGKRRPVGFITVGGTMNPHYVSMGIGPMRQISEALELTPVDQVMCTFATEKAHCMKHDDKVAHCARLGGNVALAALSGDTCWKGEAGTCPACHNNMLMLGRGDTVTCPFCGITGSVSVDGDGHIHTAFSSGAELTSLRTQPGQQLLHAQKTAREIAGFEKRQATLAEKLAQYKRLDIPRIIPKNGGYRTKEAGK